MFRDAPQDVIDILKSETVTVNFHKYCITHKVIKKYKITYGGFQAVSTKL